MATKKPQRVRVRNICAPNSRATLIAKHPAPLAPDYWGKTKVVAHVLFDHGLECLVPGRKPVKLKTTDAYERAFADPETFIKQLRLATPKQRVLMWAPIALPGGRNTSGKVLDAQGQEQTITFTMPYRAPRYTAILRKVEPALALETILLCLTGWLDDDVDMMTRHPVPEDIDYYDPDEYMWKIEYANVAYVMMGALALLVSEIAERRVLTSLADLLGPELMKEFAAVIARMETTRCNQGASRMPNLTYLHAAANSQIPGFIHGYYKPRLDSVHHTGLTLGVKDLDLPVVEH